MPSKSIDLVCTNPPFFKPSNRAVDKALSTFNDELKTTWNKTNIPKDWEIQIKTQHSDLFQILTILKKTHSIPLYNYMVFLTVRIIEIHRLLRDHGSMFLHCDPSFSHYMNLCMDNIFGQDQFRNEIAYCYYGRGAPLTQKYFQKKHQTILFYSVSDQYRFNRSEALRSPSDNVPNRAVLDLQQTLLAFDPVDIHTDMLREDWWPLSPPNTSEKAPYPNQKPRKLYRRIIATCTNEGDVVLDPFSGSGTVCVEAASMDRRWIGIDATYRAKDLLISRLSSEAGRTELHELMTETPAYIVKTGASRN